MPIITAPALPIRSIRWSLDRPAQINVSAYTAKRTVVANPWHGKWRARVELRPIVGERNVLDLRAFLAKLKGQINTFRLLAAEGEQNVNSGVTLAAPAAANSTTVTLSGLIAPLWAGQFITIADQLLLLTDVDGNEVSFEPPLRAAALAGAVVETANPTALVHMASSSSGWGVEPGQLYGIEFDVEEAI